MVSFLRIEITFRVIKYVWMQALCKASKIVKCILNKKRAKGEKKLQKVNIQENEDCVLISVFCCYICFPFYLTNIHQENEARPRSMQDKIKPSFVDLDGFP